MDTKCLTLFLLLSQHNITYSVHVTHSAHFSGIITENITFFNRKLPVTPSIRATIEFSVSYSHSSMGYLLMGIYTTYPDINIEKRCSYIRYGQLRNENLHPFLRVGRDRTTTCELSGADTVNCRGRVIVQDYIPRNFYLTFGFHCDWPEIHSLPGLEYNISFTQQSNETSGCIYYKSAMCDKLFPQTYLPNLICDETLDQVLEYHSRFRRLQGFLVVDGTCHQHFSEALCYISLTKCDPVTKQAIHPCKEMCRDIVEGCWKKWLHLIAKIEPGFSLSRRFNLDHISSLDTHQLINCDYLPSHHGSIPCFYKPVRCDSPPDATNGAAMLNSTQKDVYQVHDVVQYACVNETLRMVGNESAVCLYSGQWSTLPTCQALKEANNNVMNPIYVVVPILLVPLVILILVAGIKFKRKSSPDLNDELIQPDNFLIEVIDNDLHLLPSRRRRERDGEFDVFVVYRFDTEHNFVVNSLIPELEEARGFRLNIHFKDFQPGRNIADNIEDAIKSSNNAIILVSNGFMNRNWCVKEFTHCYIKHVEDPTFKLFLIMMKPVGELPQLSLNMNDLIRKQTYLECTDHNLLLNLPDV